MNMCVSVCVCNAHTCMYAFVDRSLDEERYEEENDRWDEEETFECEMAAFNLSFVHSFFAEGTRSSHIPPGTY